MIIWAATDADLPGLQAIELSAGEAFRELGMDLVADGEPLPLDLLQVHAEAGLAWVAVAEEEPAAYLVAAEVDGELHVEQVSVHASAARQGLGAALIETAAAHAGAVHLPALTLTTYADVPWNGPYYVRLGFAVVPEDLLTPGLAAVRAREAALGLDAWPRVVMRRPV